MCVDVCCAVRLRECQGSVVWSRADACEKTRSSGDLPALSSRMLAATREVTVLSERLLLEVLQCCIHTSFDLCFLSCVNVAFWMAFSTACGRKTVLENGIFGSPKGHFSPRGPPWLGRGVLSAHTQVPPLQKQALFSGTGSKCYSLHFLGSGPYVFRCKYASGVHGLQGSVRGRGG